MACCRSEGGAKISIVLGHLQERMPIARLLEYIVASEKWWRSKIVVKEQEKGHLFLEKKVMRHAVF